MGISRPGTLLVMPLFSLAVLLLGEFIHSPAAWASRFNILVVAVSITVAGRLSLRRPEARLVRHSALLTLSASYLVVSMRN